MTTGTAFIAQGTGNIVGGSNSAIVFTGTSGGQNVQNLRIDGKISSSADLATTFSDNVINVSGSATFGSTSVNTMDFYGPNGGSLTISDNISSRDLTYGGTLDLNLLNLASDDIMADYTSFQLFGAGGVAASNSVSGSFSAVTFTGTGFYSSISGNPWHLAETGNQYETAYGGGVWLSDWTTSGQRFIFSQNTGVLTVVPEPSTIVFASIGIVMLGWHTWTRSRRKARMSLVEDHMRRLDIARGRV